MTPPPEYAYLVWNGLFAIVWLLIFVYRKHVRKEMILSSLFWAPAGPIAMVFHRIDYFRPELIGGFSIGIEDFLMGFFFGGIAASLYETVFWKLKEKKISPGSLKLAVTMAIAGLLWMFIGMKVFEVNSVYLGGLWLMIIGMSMIYIHRSLLPNAIWSGLFVSIFLYVFYIGFESLYPGFIEDWWLLKNISGVTISKVPIEELLWAFAWGFAAGPASELAAGIKFKNFRQILK